MRVDERSQDLNQRLDEKCAGKFENLVGFAQFLDVLLVCRGLPFTLAAISFVLTHPDQQRLRRATNLGDN
jgi:hypothetical protein